MPTLSKLARRTTGREPVGIYSKSFRHTRGGGYPEYPTEPWISVFTGMPVLERTRVLLFPMAAEAETRLSKCQDQISAYGQD